MKQLKNYKEEKIRKWNKSKKCVERGGHGADSARWVTRKPSGWVEVVSNSALGLLYGHGILTNYENLLLWWFAFYYIIMSLNNIINYSKCP